MSSEADPAIDELEQPEEIVNDNVEEIGNNSRQETSSRQGSGSSRLSFLTSMTIYDAMLMVSALSVSIAVVLMVLELTSFGGLFYQWRTSEAEVNPITLP